MQQPNERRFFFQPLDEFSLSECQLIRENEGGWAGFHSLQQNVSYMDGWTQFLHKPMTNSMVIPARQVRSPVVSCPDLVHFLEVGLRWPKKNFRRITNRFLNKFTFYPDYSNKVPVRKLQIFCENVVTSSFFYLIMSFIFLAQFTIYQNNRIWLIQLDVKWHK